MPTGNALFDSVYAGTGPPQRIDGTTADADAVRILQELIRCHGYRKVPGRKHFAKPAWPGGETFGTYGF